MDLQSPGYSREQKYGGFKRRCNSFVAALLLQEAGFRLTGATLRLWVDPLPKKVFAKDSGYYLQKLLPKPKRQHGHWISHTMSLI